MARDQSALGRLIRLGAAAFAVYHVALRPWHTRWGATTEEVRRPLPGDDLVPHPRINVTHAVTIQAPVADVWPWLLQLGWGRGGWYSYTWIENLIGYGYRNADTILPQYQALDVGAGVPFGPGFTIPVAILQPGQALVLHGDTRLIEEAGQPIIGLTDYANISWGFYLNDLRNQTTRLIERWRLDYNPSLFNRLINRYVFEPGGFIMERKMLLGIKGRAENLAAQRRAQSAVVQPPSARAAERDNA